MSDVSLVIIDVVSKPNMSNGRKTQLPLHLGSCRGIDLEKLIVKTITTSQDLQGIFTNVQSAPKPSSAVHL